MRLLERLVDAREDEVRALLLSAAYFFFVLSAYYVLRPIRDEMGVAGGVRNLPWLFTGTLVAVLLVHPLYAALVSRLPRRRFIPYAYRFFAANLLIFFVAMKLLPESMNLWVGRAFYVWVSVFNLFVVSVFWSFMADIFRNEQGKRLFAVIGVGGTIGAMTGSGITALLAEQLGTAQLLLISVVLLEAAVLCALRLSSISHDADLRVCHKCGADISSLAANAVCPGCGWAEAKAATDEAPVGGGALSGVTLVLRSPYLLGICLYMFLFTTLATYLYFQQAEIIAGAFENRAERTAVFGWIDFAVNSLTLLLQLFVTGRLMKVLGVGVTLGVLPVVCVIGFAGLGLYPTLAVLVVFQVFRRAANYAVSRPSREVLYTIVPRDQKYQAKNFIDTFVYRGSDQVGAWSYHALGVFGLGMTAISFLAVPLAGLWIGVGWWLGRQQAELAKN